MATLDLGNGKVPSHDHFPARSKEGLYFVEDRLFDDFVLEQDQRLVAVGGKRAICDKQFVEYVEFAKVTQRLRGFYGRLQAFAQPVERRGTVDRYLRLSG